MTSMEPDEGLSCGEGIGGRSLSSRLVKHLS